MSRFTFLIAISLLAACGPMTPAPDAGAGRCTVTLSGTYPDSAFAQNAQAEAALLGKLNALNAPMRNAELDAGTVTSRQDLDQLFNAGTPSLASLTSPAFTPVLDQTLTAFLAAQGKLWTPANPPVGSGGLYGSGTSTRIFSERGVDLRQLVDKGLYGALFYSEFVKRLPTATSPEAIDRLLALYGATPAFPQNDTTAAGRDELTAKYAKRRNPMGAAGSYTIIRDAFIKARLAAGSADCSAERVEALEAIKLEWERVLASTVIFYVNSGATKLQDANADATKKASALQDLGEGAAFFVGLKAVPAANRKITDAQIDQVLSGLRASTLQQATVFRLVTDVPPDIDGLLQVNAQLQQVYGFNADDLMRFRTNY